MDYALETTFDYKFTTRAFATGVPTTLSGTPAIDIYEDNSVTQITTAETLTVDFDSVTGLNNLRIVATAANGFESGKSYAAVITTGTVGGVSVVGEVICNFSIERTAAVRPTTAGRTLDVTATGAAGIDWGNVENQGASVDLSDTAIDLCDEVTINTDMRGTDSAALAATALTNVTWTDARAGYVDNINGHTAQTADHTAGIADIPTVAEFNARTLPSADYVVTTDTIAGVTTVTNLTNAPTSGDLTATMKASVNTEVDTAIETYHLDHLLAVDYDPASKPGVATALLNEIIESDGGVSRLTANALEALLTVEADNDGTAISVAGALKLILAVLTGKSSGGGGSTIVFRDIGDAKNRISATVDANGNRTAVGTRDAT